jgi:hypothetical protein
MALRRFELRKSLIICAVIILGMQLTVTKGDGRQDIIPPANTSGELTVRFFK